MDNVFDYERQTEIFIQVQAKDTLQTMGEATHTTFTQVRIDVIDVNDEAPQLKMVSWSLGLQNRHISGKQ